MHSVYPVEGNQTNTNNVKARHVNTMAHLEHVVKTQDTNLPYPVPSLSTVEGEGVVTCFTIRTDTQPPVYGLHINFQMLEQWWPSFVDRPVRLDLAVTWASHSNMRKFYDFQLDVSSILSFATLTAAQSVPSPQGPAFRHFALSVVGKALEWVPKIQAAVVIRWDTEYQDEFIDLDVTASGTLSLSLQEEWGRVLPPAALRSVLHGETRFAPDEESVLSGSATSSFTLL